MALPFAPCFRRAALGLGVATLAVCSLALPASAHPHVWVSVDTTVVVEKGAVVGFRHKWTFDEFYSAMAIDGLDTNKDGIYSREELAELAKVNIDGLKEFKFFTFAKLGAADLVFDEPKDYWLTHGVAPAAAKTQPAPQPPAPEQKSSTLGKLWSSVTGGEKKPEQPEPTKVLTLEFTLPLKQPVLIDAAEFEFAIYDPSWFIAFDVATADAIRLGEGAPPSCRIDTAEKATEGPNADDSKKLEDAFSSQFGGTSAVTLTGTRQFRVNCTPKS